MKIFFNGYFYSDEKRKIDQATFIFSEKFNISNNFFFNLHSVDEKKSKSLNSQYFQKNLPADVLSFPLYKNIDSILKLNPQNEEDLGDMFINRKIVKKNSKIYDKSFVEELQFIIIHGLLHLVGYTHDNEIELRKIEDEIMKMVWDGS
ncbi:MAG: rRNA maturation RNase YbeY [Actinomycetota bacterium]|nr:rRNA maturation RNase YbeY [Actinomycetota bacterium]